VTGAYLLEVTNRVPNRIAFQELVDLLFRYRYEELFLYSEREFAAPAEFDSYCRMQGVALTVLDRDAYDALLMKGETVAVKSEAQRSLCGRVEAMRESMIAAEAEARRRHARRFLVTDFSDGYEWHPPCVSLPAIVMGGTFASSGAKAANMDLEHELDSVLGAPLAKHLLELGTLYLRGGAYRDGESEYFNILAGDCGYSRHPGLTQSVLDEVSGIVRGIRVAAERWVDRSDRAKEIVYAANLLDAACHRRSEPLLRDIRDEHGRIWRQSFAPEGRVESLSRLPRF